MAVDFMRTEPDAGIVNFYQMKVFTPLSNNTCFDNLGDRILSWPMLIVQRSVKLNLWCPFRTFSSVGHKLNIFFE